MIDRSSEFVGVAQKVARVAGWIFTVCAMVLMAVLVFFLLQSRLAGGTPSVAGHKLYVVLGGSMSPAFEAGSVVLVRPLDPLLVRMGDIITFQDPDPERPGMITTHRVEAIHADERLAFTTRGDANDAADPLPVQGEDVLGRVALAIPYVGYLLSFVQTDRGMLLLIIVPALLIIVFELRRLFGYARVLETQRKGAGQ